MKISLIVLITGFVALSHVRATPRSYNLYAVHSGSGQVFAAGGRTPESRGSVVRLGANGSAQSTLLTADGEFIALAVNDRTARIAALERLIEIPPRSGTPNFREGQREGFERSTLHVLSPEGSKLVAVPNVRNFAWRPDGGKLAVVVGTYQGHDREPALAGVQVVSIDGTGRTISRIGGHVEWATFDNAVYIWDTATPGKTNVLRYDPSTDKLESTPYHSVYFSRSGDYYFKPDGIAGRPGVFWRTTNADLTSSSRVFADIVAYNPESWAPDADVLLLEARKRDRKIVRLLYDVIADTAIEVERNDVLRWGRSRSELLMKDNSGAVLKDISRLKAAQ